MEITKVTTSLALIIVFVITILRIYETIKLLIDGDSYWVSINFLTIIFMVLSLLFPMNYLMSILMSLFLRKKYLLTNSKYYSSSAPIDSTLNKINIEPILELKQNYNNESSHSSIESYICENEQDKLNNELLEKRNNMLLYLPPVTIQLPVYDEDFKKVLRPTIRTCIKVRDDYISQGGECNIVVNDDGIFKFANDKISELTKNKNIIERINYYKKYNIGFTARKLKERKGRFKKGSNMNFGLNKITTHVFDLDIYREYTNKLNMKKQINKIILDPESKLMIDLDETNNKSSLETCKDDFLTNIVLNEDEISAVYGDISFGKYFILIDSDSIIPTCSGKFIKTIVKEFELDEKLAYTQHYTIPLQTSYQNYFSRQISHYTVNLNEITFRLSTRNGDISPLIGHNICVRTSALNEVSTNINDNIIIWSEDRVSEDFDMCLRFHTAGYYGKYIAYPDMVFEEGVSLSYKDEMIKYSKFAFGASEILFNPMSQWCRKGIFTKNIKKFMKSSTIPWTSKIGIVGYMMSYFTVGSSIPFSPAILLTSCYLENWELLFFDVFYAYLFTLIMFTVIAPVSSYLIKKRLENETVTPNNKVQSKHYPKVKVISEIKSAIFFSLFYSSISFPIFIGLISHMFSVNISWGSTVKTLKSDKCCKTIIKIILDEKLQFIVMLIYLSILLFFNLQYDCNNIYVSISLLSVIIGHLITPFLLNPMLFKFTEHKYDIANTPSPQHVYRKGFI
jgi:hypothetical protein